MEDIFRGYGVEVRLEHPEDFLKVKETLTRIGVASYHSKTLFQSCHILHKRGRYAIIHFKELFALDGLADSIPEEDIARRNTIVNLLEEWELLEIVDPDKSEHPVVDVRKIKIIPFREKNEWQLVPKYSIGK